MEEQSEYDLIGLALVAAQRVEFILYGLAAHASHLPAAQQQRRLRELTPEKFLRGDIKELKATMGQLIEIFGDAFSIKTPDLILFYNDRNFLTHDFVRVFRMRVRGSAPRTDSREFLLDFLKRALYWENTLRGLLSELMAAAAFKEGREAELVISEEDANRMRTFEKHVERYLKLQEIGPETK